MATQGLAGSLRTALEITAALASIFLCGAVGVSMLRGSGRPPAASARPAATSARPPLPLPTSPVDIASATLRGSPTAKVAVIEFSDFECPFCKRFTLSTLPSLLTQFVDSGKVLFAFRHLPLPIHKSATRIAEAAVCADEQGRFWAFQDQAFRTDTSPDSLSTLTRTLGLRDQQYQGCLAGPGKTRVAADLAQARELGITGTPTFLIGVRQSDGQVKVTQRLNGAVPMADFENAITQALTAAQPR